MRPGRLLALLVGLGIGAALIWVSHPAAIWRSLQEIQPLPLLGALLINVPVIVLRAYRAQVILGFLGHRTSLRSMIPVQLLGQTSSTITPAASGDYLRAYIWRRDQGIPVRDGAAVVTLERLFSLALLMAVAVLLITLPRHGLIGWLGVAIGLVATSLGPAVVEMIAPPTLERWALSRLTSWRRLNRFAEGAFGLADNLRLLFRSPILLLRTSAITLAVFVLSGAQVWLLLVGVGDSAKMTQAVAVYAASQVAGILSTLPFGLGAADAILVTVLAGYGIAVGDGATVAILSRAVSTLPQGLAGLIEYLRLVRRSAGDSEDAGTKDGAIG